MAILHSVPKQQIDNEMPKMPLFSYTDQLCIFYCHPSFLQPAISVISTSLLMIMLVPSSVRVKEKQYKMTIKYGEVTAYRSILFY